MVGNSISCLQIHQNKADFIPVILEFIDNIGQLFFILIGNQIFRIPDLQLICVINLRGNHVPGNAAFFLISLPLRRSRLPDLFEHRAVYQRSIIGKLPGALAVELILAVNLRRCHSLLKEAFLILFGFLFFLHIDFFRLRKVRCAAFFPGIFGLLFRLLCKLPGACSLRILAAIPDRIKNTPVLHDHHLGLYLQGTDLKGIRGKKQKEGHNGSDPRLSHHRLFFCSLCHIRPVSSSSVCPYAGRKSRRKSPTSGSSPANTSIAALVLASALRNS